VTPALALSGSNLTGEHAFTCCLRTAHGTFAAQPAPGQRGDLACLARELLAAHGVAAAELGELRVDLGPGSYTGLRVALTFARFLQHFGGLAVQACDSLALLASAAAAVHPRLRPLLDARRGRFHCATFVATAERLHVAEPAAALLHGDLLATVTSDDLFVVPRGLAPEHKAALRQRGARLAEVAGVTAARLFDLRLALHPHAPAQLEPRYLMASYAG
jgi:tRNA threonylcarbamoyladenosine biosynthesis protein TsaB